MESDGWICEEHLEKKGDTETYYDLAKSVYENYVQRRSRLGNRAFEMIRVSGMITSILGAVLLFALINYPSHYLIILLPGLVTLLAGIIVYLPLWRVPNFRIVDIEEIEEEYERGELEKDKAAERFMNINKWYRDDLLPEIRKILELQNMLTKVGVIISIAGIILIFILELILA